MYAIRCPRCGSPEPVSLSAPESFSCGACQFRGALPAETAEDLRSAARTLGAHNARERQLSRFQRRMMLSSWFASAVYVAAISATLAPLGCCFIASIAAQTGPFDWTWVMLFGIPLVFVGLLSASGFLFARKRLVRVRQMLAATPPATPGAPSRCHVCGAEIVAVEGEAFVRCEFCSADNLTDPQVLAGLSLRRDLVLDHYEANASERSRIAKEATRSAVYTTATAVLLAPIVTCLLTFPAFAVMIQIETDPYPTLEYATVETSHGVCVVAVSPERRGRRRLRSFWGTDDDGRLSRRRPSDHVPTFRYSELIGLRVQERVPGRGEMRVVGVYGTAGTAQNRVKLVADDGFERDDWPNRLCLVDGVPPPSPPIPLEAPTP